MISEQKRYVVGIFFNYSDVERTLSELYQVGFRASQISLIVKYREEQYQLSTTQVNHMEDDTLDEVMTGAVAGSLFGSLLGCLAGIGILSLPGVGFLIAAGTAGTTLVSILSGAGIGAVSGGLISALANSLGTSEQAVVDRPNCDQNEYLLIVDGTNQEVARTEYILNQSCPSRVWIC